MCPIANSLRPGSPAGAAGHCAEAGVAGPSARSKPTIEATAIFRMTSSLFAFVGLYGRREDSVLRDAFEERAPPAVAGERRGADLGHAVAALGRVAQDDLASHLGHSALS
jgi:hypothetical protein